MAADAEISIVALIKAVVKRLRLPSSVETAPLHSSESIGVVSRYAQTVAAQSRTLRLHVEGVYSRKVRACDPPTPWLVRHA